MSLPAKQPFDMSRAFRQKPQLCFNFWGRLESITEICETVEADIARKLTELDAQAKLLHSEPDDERKSDLIDSIGDDYFTYSNQWTQVIRESFYLALCSSFEYHLMELSEEYAKYVNPSVVLTDIRDKGLRKCERILKMAGIPHSAFGKEWLALKELYRFRNRIAHAGAIHDAETMHLATKHQEIVVPPGSTERRIAITRDGVSGLAKVMIGAIQKIRSAIG